MKIRELIEALQKFDPELEVYASKDDEGNGYRKLTCEPATGRVDPRETHYIESFYFDEWSDEDCCLDPGERDDMIRAICL